MLKPGKLDINRLVKEGFLTASPRTHGGKYYLRNAGSDIIDFSTNVNPLGPSRKVIAAIRQNLHLVSSYPDPDSREFRTAAGEYLKVEEECVIAGNGANELIHLFADVFIGRNDKVVIPVPTFYEYEFACDRNSAKIEYVELDNFMLDRDAVLEAMNGAKAVFICNPNNPTGMLANRNDVEKIVDHAYNNNILVMLDECFMEFVDEPGRNSLVQAVKEYDNLVVLRTLTKAFGLAGLRAGYCVANEKISRLLGKAKIPWSVNALAQKAAAVALRDLQHLERTRRLIKREKAYLQHNLAKILGFRTYSSDANFFLIVTEKTDSLALKEKMLKKKILVRDCSSFTGMTTGHVRISTQRRKDNTLFIKAMGEV